MKKDEVRRLSVEATRFGSTVDPSIAIVAADGTEVIRNDDLLNTLDAAVDFKAPADGTYDVVVTDYSGEDPSPVNTSRLLVEDPEALLPLVRNAGGVFLGESSPEVLGDYTAGPSHVMPTGGAARFASPLSVLDFLKITSVISLSETDLARLGPYAASLARAEGLTGHARSIERRLEGR